MTATKWQLKREASYEALVSSAVRCFHDRGYAATRVEDIVAGTGYSKGAFYFHFENKLDCFWHAIRYREDLRGSWTQLPEELDPESTSLEQVLREVFAGFAVALQGLNAWVLVMVDLFQQHREDAEVKEKTAEIYNRWQQDLSEFVGALQSGGWVSPKRDPGLIARQIFAFTEGLTVHARLYGLSDDSFEEALYDGLLRILD